MAQAGRMWILRRNHKGGPWIWKVGAEELSPKPILPLSSTEELRELPEPVDCASVWGADIYQIGLNISLAKILFAEIKIYSLELKCKDVREDELQKEKGQYIKYFPKYAITPSGPLRQREGEHRS